MTLAQLDLDSFARWRAVVGRALARRGVPPADRDDLAQEVFLVLHRRAPVLVDDRAANAWLCATAWRIASNHRRARLRNDDRLLHVPAPARASTPEEQCERAEIASTFTRFLAELPPDTRVLFERIEIEGASAPEVAHATGANLDTVYAKIRRTRARWTAKLASLGLGLLLLVLAALASHCATPPESIAQGGEREPAVVATRDVDVRPAALRPDEDRPVRTARRHRHPARPARMPILRA